MDVLLNEVTVYELKMHGDGHTGVLVSSSEGSIILEGMSQMAQDDCMLNAVEGGALVPDSGIKLGR